MFGPCDAIERFPRTSLLQSSMQLIRTTTTIRCGNLSLCVGVDSILEPTVPGTQEQRNNTRKDLDTVSHMTDISAEAAQAVSEGVSRHLPRRVEDRKLTIWDQPARLIVKAFGVYDVEGLPKVVSLGRITHGCSAVYSLCRQLERVKLAWRRMKAAGQMDRTSWALQTKQRPGNQLTSSSHNRQTSKAVLLQVQHHLMQPSRTSMPFVRRLGRGDALELCRG